MAAVIEDEQAQVREFLEQQRLLEEERLARQEAARLLAEQDALAAQMQDAPPYGLIDPAPIQPNFMSQPQAEIDALQAQFNAPAPTPRQMIGDAQYQAEVARAQRGSGFINAVGDVPGYDPERDPRAIIARQEATNLQRNQYVDSLIKGGATYAEAYRAGQGRHPQSGNDAMRLKVAELALSTQPFTPRMETISGVPMMQTGPKVWRVLPQQKFEGGKASEATKIAADNIADQITSLRRRLEPGPTGILLTPPDEVAAIKAEIAQKEKARVDLFSGPESNPKVDRIGWENMRDAFNAPSRAPIPVAPTAATPAQAETITITTKEQFEKLPPGTIYITKDGRKARK